MSSLKWLSAFLLAAALLHSAPARADMHLVTEAMTDAPLDVGAKILFEAPGRIRINVGVGVMPSFYVSGYSGIAQLFGKMDQSHSDVVQSALDNSLVGRIHLGWRVFEDRGLYLDAGYGFAAFGGGNSAAAVLAKISGGQMPPMDNGDSYKINSVIHMLDAEVGWQWILFWQFQLRVAVGVAYTFASTSTITPAFPSKVPDQQAQFTQSVAASLDGGFKNTWTPIATLGLGWQWF